MLGLEETADISYILNILLLFLLWLNDRSHYELDINYNWKHDTVTWFLVVKAPTVFLYKLRNPADRISEEYFFRLFVNGVFIWKCNVKRTLSVLISLLCASWI
jgi:hypothetical protein